MMQYIKADLFRIFRKKSVYYFIFGCSVLYAGVLIILMTAGVTMDTYTIVASVLLNMVGLIVGTFVFALVFTDDLRSKSLQTAIGFGKRRSEIVMVKFFDVVIVMSIFILIIFGVLSLTPLLLSFGISLDLIRLIALNSLSAWLSVVVYTALACNVVYLTQKSTASVTAFVVMITGAMSTILTLILDQEFITKYVGQISRFMPANLMGSFGQGIINSDITWVYSLIGLVIYIVVSLVLSTVFFKHKELEF